ncbi:hypothetical protein FB451DRAFT_1416903 [Mycena latifolia]|nr:hypothetical protein FB451DRAFT_1416903 [Mycena latifolia]
MVRPSKRRVAALRANHAWNDKDDSGSSDDENIPPDGLPFSQDPPRHKPTTLRSQIAEKDARIAELEATISGLQTDFLALQHAHNQLRLEHTTLLQTNQTISCANTALKTLKRKADSEHTEELGRRQKRIKRLELERANNQQQNLSTISGLQSSLHDSSAQIARLKLDLASAISRINSSDTTIVTLKSSLHTKQTTLTEIRKRLYAALKQADRAKSSFKEAKKAYDTLRIWNPMESGEYTAAARELVRQLSYAGCAAGKIEFAVKCCAQTFGIEIRRRFMSARTVGRAIDEGGKYGELQLAREIMDAPGFVKSSDGTMHRGITVEARLVTMLVPSYAPNTDDTDQSTWTYQTRFVEAAPALDHTGQRQFEGTVAMATQMANTYSCSPLAARERRTMDKNDYWRKKLGESKDHAADGKKEFRLSVAHKKDIVIRDMGRLAMDDADVDTSQILLTMLSITNEELADAGKLSESEFAALSTEARSLLVEEVLERKIGEETFDSLPPAEQSNKCTHLFGGCCCHKDLNVVEYGYKSIQRAYSTYNLPPPVLLANKANSAAINSGGNDSSTIQNAIDSSTSGAIKLLQLIGALLRHKDGERGYQDKCTIFLRERKLALYGLDNPGKFPDVSNTWYGCYTYAAAEVVCYHGIIQEMVMEVINGKTKSGQANHVEHNILKGLNCAVTMTELVALALYGVSVSWPYMAQVRSTKDKPVNLLSLTDLHRKLPQFCAHVAANPHILLDPTTPPDELTIDGKPFLDEFLLASIKQLRPDLPNLFLIISQMFSGCETGWIIFTPEFHIGGTFDSLTPEQRLILHIPATNDPNEGILGTFRVHMRYHPNSTAHSFTNQTRAERNNTEAFIKKCCDGKDKTFVMREVRKDGANQPRAQFRRTWAKLHREKAERALARRAATALKKKTKAARLAATPLEFRIDKIQGMSSALLKDQLAVYRDILKDPILTRKLWKEMNTVAVRRNLVLEARERELERRKNSNVSGHTKDAPATSKDNIVVEHGFSEEDDGEWEDE